jgi:hypothetical protein
LLNRLHLLLLISLYFLVFWFEWGNLFVHGIQNDFELFVVHEEECKTLNNIVVEFLRGDHISALVFGFCEVGGGFEQQVAEDELVVHGPEGAFNKYIFQKVGIARLFYLAFSAGVVLSHQFREKLCESFGFIVLFRSGDELLYWFLCLC